MQDLGPPMASRMDLAQGSSLDPFPWKKKNSLCWEWRRMSNFCWMWVFYSMYGIFFCSSGRWEKNVYFSWVSKNPNDTQKKGIVGDFQTPIPAGGHQTCHRRLQQRTLLHLHGVVEGWDAGTFHGFVVLGFAQPGGKQGLGWGLNPSEIPPRPTSPSRVAVGVRGAGMFPGIVKSSEVPRARGSGEHLGAGTGLSPFGIPLPHLQGTEGARSLN